LPFFLVYRFLFITRSRVAGGGDHLGGERAAVRGASLVVPDGQPVVWAMNALGGDLERRVYGPELMARYCERAAGTGTRMYLYGGRNQGALVQLALNLRQRFPGVKIVGGYSPPFRDLSEEEEDAIVAEMNGSKADVIWVGVGAPKQEKWMAAMRERVDAPVLVGVGAAFDFHAGLVPQRLRVEGQKRGKQRSGARKAPREGVTSTGREGEAESNKPQMQNAIPKKAKKANLRKTWPFWISTVCRTRSITATNT